MPATVYGRAQAQRRGDLYKVKPTLLIGLGGTGKEVLLRLRQRFIEKHNIVGFPTMAYLWIDTDTQNHNIDGKAIDYIAEQALFQPGEWINAQVPGNDFKAIFDNHTSNHHIFSWLYPSLSALGSVINGSRQLRPLGRLGFFRHYSTIQLRLNAVHNDIMGQQARQDMLERHGIQVEGGNGLQVVIVCSLAGGTGSGMFLDTAFLVKRTFGNANTDVLGYLVLPPVFAPAVAGSEPIYANAYAALKELEFYSMRKDLLSPEAKAQADDDHRFTSAHDFVVDWGNTGETAAIAGPPFNTCYLINNQTLGGGILGPEDKTHLCDMIAENIFMDFHTQSFSDKKRSVRSNLDDYLLGELEYQYLDGQRRPMHSEIFSCRFSTMGFTKMYVPTDRIRKACAYQLALDLVDRWLARTDIPGTLEEHVRQTYLGPLNLRVSSVADDFRMALERNDDSGRTFWQEIATAWTDLEKRALLERIKLATPGLKTEIERRMQGYNQAKLAKPNNPDYWGAFVRRLELENRKAFLERTQRAILETLKAWLRDPYVRLEAAVEYLQTVNTIIEKHRRFFEQARDQAARRARTAYDEYRILVQIIDEEERGWWVHRWSLRPLVEEVCEKIRLHFEQLMRSMVFGVAAEACAELQSFIGRRTVETNTDGSEVVIHEGLLREMWRIAERFRVMRTDLQAKLESFKRTERHLIFENLYEPEMYRNYYMLQNADGRRLDLRQTEQIYYDEAKLDGLYDLKVKAEQIGWENVQKELEAFCLTRFQNLDIEVDVVHKFYEMYPKTEQRRPILERFVHNGTVWLQPSRRARVEKQIIENYDDDVEIGLNQEGMIHHYYQEFSQEVRNLIDAAAFRSPVNAPVDVPKDTVYLYSEFAGIPLAYIADIEEYKNAYLKMARRGRQLHIDSNEEQFADIVIKENREVAETIRVNRVLFVGAILRVVELNTHEGRIQYHYIDKGVIPPQRRPLGSQMIAVETLRADQDLLTALEREVNEVRRKLPLQRRRQFLAILTYYTMDGNTPGTQRGPYSPTYLTVGGQTIQKLSPEHRAIDAVIRQENQSIQDETRIEAQLVAEDILERYRHLDEFSEPVVFGDKIHRILKEEGRV